MADFFGIDAEGSTDLTKLSQVVEIRKKGRKELNAFLQKRFTDITPNDDVRWLTTRPWRAIFTTNYDNGIERAYELNPHTIQNPVVPTVTADGPYQLRTHPPLSPPHSHYGEIQPRQSTADVLS
jgi:hypothetical protein